MIQLFYTDENLKLQTLEANDYIKLGCDLKYKWLHLTNPTDKEIENLAEITQIPEDHFKAALDEEERARIEKEDGILLLLFDIPVMEAEEGGYYSYTTIPLGIILKDDFIITVVLRESSLIRDFITGRIKDLDTMKRTKFIFQLLYQNAKKYLNYLKQIDRASQRIQKELHKSTKNKELIQLLDLENSLVYFSTSLKSNEAVINKLVYSSTYVKKYEEDQDLVEDVAIENKQASDMCTIYRDILSGTMDAFASVISNNQNEVIRLLTIVTILIAIPSTIASYFGMNVKLPFANVTGAFWFLLLIPIAIAVLLGFIFIRRR